MFDARLRPLIDPPLKRVAVMLVARGVSAEALTLGGCGLGLCAAIAVVFGWFWTALLLFLLGRIADGLDGAVARLTTPTDRGAFLDIVCDFLVYGAIPLAFAVHAPAQNALAAACLLAAFLANGIAFLAFALMAERRQMTTDAQGKKGLYYLAGLAEGAETIVIFALMMLFPKSFPGLAWGFAVLTTLSALARMAQAYRVLRRLD
jgi:phosphatidylglycerophosphate synthase